MVIKYGKFVYYFVCMENRWSGVYFVALSSHRFQIFEQDDAGGIRGSHLSCESEKGKFVVVPEI